MAIFLILKTSKIWFEICYKRTGGTPQQDKIPLQANINLAFAFARCS